MAVNIIFIEIAFICMLEIIAIPFVISSNPVKKGAIKAVGIFEILKKGDIKMTSIFKNLLALNIDIITEKSTIKPPITIVEEIALNIEFDNISPNS